MAGKRARENDIIFQCDARDNTEKGGPSLWWQNNKGTSH